MSPKWCMMGCGHARWIVSNLLGYPEPSTFARSYIFKCSESGVESRACAAVVWSHNPSFYENLPLHELRSLLSCLRVKCSLPAWLVTVQMVRSTQHPCLPANTRSFYRQLKATLMSRSHCRTHMKEGTSHIFPQKPRRRVIPESGVCAVA